MRIEVCRLRVLREGGGGRGTAEVLRGKRLTTSVPNVSSFSFIFFSCRMESETAESTSEVCSMRDVTQRIDKRTRSEARRLFLNFTFYAIYEVVSRPFFDPSVCCCPLAYRPLFIVRKIASLSTAFIITSYAFLVDYPSCPVSKTN